MDNLFLSEAAQGRVRCPVIPANLLRISLRCVEVLFGIAAAGVVLGILFLFATSREAGVSGRMISSDTKKPISDVMVAVQSVVPFREKGMGRFVRTDADGKFVANAKGEVVITAWKPGYGMNGISAGYAVGILSREIVVELRPMTATNWVSEHWSEEGFGPGDGFSFQSGKIVSVDSPDADIVLTQDAVGTRYIDARRDGGVIFQHYGAGIDFQNTPEAPPAEYSKRLAIPGDVGAFYVRAQDGNHYAKVRFFSGLKQTPNGIDHSYLWLQWAYQPDGTRNLEVKPGKDLPFPVEEFGLSRESLEQ
jgi:hypothetical protein